VAGPKRLGGVCTSVGDVLSRAARSPLLYTAAVVRLRTAFVVGVCVISCLKGTAVAEHCWNPMGFAATPVARVLFVKKPSSTTARPRSVWTPSFRTWKKRLAPLVATNSRKTSAGTGIPPASGPRPRQVWEALSAREAAFLAVECSLTQGHDVAEDVDGSDALDGRPSQGSGGVGGALSNRYLLTQLALWSEKHKPSRVEYALAKIIAFNAVRQRALFDYVLQTNIVRDRSAIDQEPHRIKSEGMHLSIAQRALLHTALAQYAFMERVPVYTIVFSTVEIAKTYFGQRFAAFANAILRNLVRYGEKYAADLESRRPASYIVRPLPFPADALDVRYSYPAVFASRVFGQLLNRKRLMAFLEAGNMTPQTFLRVPRQYAQHEDLKMAIERRLLVPWSDQDSTETVSRPWIIYRVDLQCAGEDPGAALPLTLPSANGTGWADDPANVLTRSLFQRLLQHFIAQNVTQAEHTFLLCEQLRQRWDKERRIARVLDLCTAPGGKLTAVFEYLQYSDLGDAQTEYIGIDLSDQRIHMVHENVDKTPGMRESRVFVGVARGESFVDCRAGNILRSEDERAVSPCFDLVIADVPCTNSGVLNRRPEARWRLDEQHFASSVPRLVSLQASLLNRACLLSRSAVFYMTCSVLHAEGRDLVRSVLENHRDFELVWDHLTYTDAAGRDGGYAAMLWRRPSH